MIRSRDAHPAQVQSPAQGKSDFTTQGSPAPDTAEAPGRGTGNASGDWATGAAGPDGHGVRNMHQADAVDSGFAALLRAPSSSTASDVDVSDWDTLFHAVLHRLRSLVGECTPLVGSGAPVSASKQRQAIAESVEALEQLHQSMANELGRRQSLELEVFDARTELAQARAELVGTRDGERRARYLALHDSLTSLPNRIFFVSQLDHALNLSAPQRRPLAIMYLDLDGFKHINDTHGHAAGDELLRVVAARLSRVVRTEDMISRLGGDEFACLLGGLNDTEQLRQLAGKLFEAVASPCKIGSLRLVVRPSIGIAVWPQDGVTSDALLRSADAAMYLAKRHATRHAFCEPA
ncbi:MAG: GGDEF domain-containing protein [Burkholderiaceae bacterium]